MPNATRRRMAERSRAPAASAWSALASDARPLASEPSTVFMRSIFSVMVANQSGALMPPRSGSSRRSSAVLRISAAFSTAGPVTVRS